MAFTTPATGLTESASNPAWYQAGLAGLLSDAQDIYGMNQNFTPYTGQVVAPTTALQQQAQTGAQNLMGGLANYGQNMQQFMNPYTQNVVNQVATLGNRNLTENVLPQTQSGFTSAGQFGSKRMMDFQNRAIRDNQESIANQQGQLLNQGWQQANQAQNMNFGQQLQGLNQLNQLGTEDWNRQQQQNQFNLQQWNTQQQYPFQSFGWLSNVVRGLQPGQVGGVNYQLGGMQLPQTPNYLQTLGGLAQTSYALGGGR